MLKFWTIFEKIFLFEIKNVKILDEFWKKIFFNFK